jgi:hypothetical protein
MMNSSSSAGSLKPPGGRYLPGSPGGPPNRPAGGRGSLGGGLLKFNASVLRAAGSVSIYYWVKFPNISLLKEGSFVVAMIDATSIASGYL